MSNAPKLIEVIESYDRRGMGTPEDPVRMVTCYHTPSGELLASVDGQTLADSAALTSIANRCRKILRKSNICSVSAIERVIEMAEQSAQKATQSEPCPRCKLPEMGSHVFRYEGDFPQMHFATPSPAVEDAEPVGYFNRDHHGWSIDYKDEATAKREASYDEIIETAVPLYRHPSPVSGAVAAGKGVKDDLIDAAGNRSIAFHNWRTGKGSADHFNEEVAKFEGLLDKIVELPEPTQDAKAFAGGYISRNNSANKEQALQFAAALVQAAQGEGGK